MKKEELPERYFYNRNKIYSIGQILKDVIPKRGHVEKAYRNIENSWRIIVGEEVFSKTEILYIKNRTLYVKAESSTIAHHLTNFERLAIISQINDIMGNKYIDDVRFKVGRLKDDGRE